MNIFKNGFYIMMLLFLFGNSALSQITSNPSDGTTKIDESFVKRDKSYELVDKRDAFSKHFQNVDGSIRAIISQSPIHYWNKKTSTWEEIRMDIRPNSGESNTDFPLAVTENDYQLYFSNTVNKGHLLKLPAGDVLLGAQNKMWLLSPNGVESNVLESDDNAIPIVQGNKIVYKGAYPFGDDQIIVRSTGVDHEIVLNEKPAFINSSNNGSSLVVREFLKLPKGWKIVSSKEVDSPQGGEVVNKSGLVIIDDKGNYIADILQPNIKEMNNRNEISLDLTRTEGVMKVVPTQDGFYLETHVPVSWLNDSQRVYPIIIDPSVTIYNNTVNWYSGFSSNSSTCYTGYDYSGDFISYPYTYPNGWMYFLTSSVPNGASVSNITLSYYNYASGVTNPSIAFRKAGAYTNNCATLWSAETGGTVYYSGNGPGAAGRNSVTLGGTANADFQSLIAGGTFGVAYQETVNSGSNWMYIYGWYYGITYAPYITVDYTTCYAAPAPPLATNDGPVCPGGNVNLTAEGLAPGKQVISLNNNGTGSGQVSEVSNNFTVEFWANPTSTITTPTQSNSGAITSGHRWVVFPWHGGTAANNKSGSGISVGTNGVLVGEHADGYLPPILVWNGAISGWTHIAIVYASKQPKLYINGVLVQTGATSTKGNVYPSVGSSNGYGGYTGTFDNIRIWNKSLSLAEIQNVMNYEMTPATAPTVNLIHQYKFNGNLNDNIGALNWPTSNQTFQNANYYTYTWTGLGTLPTPSINETQTATTSAANPWTYEVFATIGTGCTSPNKTATLVLRKATSIVPLETTVTPAGTCGGANVVLKVNDKASKGGEIDRSGWTVGSGSITGFAVNETVGTENARINATDPWGKSTVVWEARASGDGTADGGWNGSLVPIDNTKTYRYSVWVKRTVQGTLGRFYFGLQSNVGGANSLAGAFDGNPYFWYSSTPAGSELPTGEWVLVVGYVHPNAYTGVTDPTSGRYTLSGGRYGGVNYDYKWAPGTTQANLRTYLYYADGTAKQQWVYPRMDVVDGSEPSVQDLLNGFDANGGLGANANWKWHTNSIGGAVAGTGNSITVAPTATTRYFVRAEGGDCPLTTISKEATVTINPPVANPTITAVGATTYCNTGTVELTASDVNLAKNALSFTGGQSVNLGNPPELQITKDQTIEMWLKPSAFSGRLNPYDKAYAGEGTITQEPDGSLNYYYGTDGTNGAIYQGFASAAALTVGQWNHIALVRDLTNMTLNWYINGVLTNSTPAVYPAAVAGANPVRIGLGYAGGYEGEIDELRVWNIARSQAAIQADMNQPIQAGTTGLAGYWRFDETSGTVVLDASGNSNTGTFGAPAPTRVIPSTAPMAPLYTWTPATDLDVTSGKVVNASPTATTTYTVTLANPFGCVDGTKTQQIKVDIPSTLPTSITVDNGNVNNCHGRELTLTEVGGTLKGTAKYKWGTTSGGTQVSTGTTSTTVTHTPTATTNYYVGVTANGTCPAQTNTTPLVYILPAKLGALSGNEAATCYVSGTNPIHFYSASKKYIGSVNPNGRTGTLTMTSYTGTGGTMFACDAPTNPKFKTAYMGRNFTVIPTGAISGAGSLSVYFPFTGTELTNLQTASTTDTPGNTKDDVTAITDLVMTQHSGPTEDGDPFNNCADGSSIVVTLTASGALNTAFTLSPAVTANYGQIDISSFSEFYFQGLNNNSPLPVTLTSFTANCDNQVTLTWSTASEQNSDKFIVEKSRDGQNWLAVGEQSAAGNSNTMITYNETDENPLNGINYYRLRQTDLNGVEQIYGPISTTCSGNENNSMTVYPNPNNGAFTVEISSIENHTGAQLLLTDMTGRTVVSQIVNITAGTNQIMISNGDLQMGTYMVTVRGIDSELKPVKVVVNR